MKADDEYVSEWMMIEFIRESTLVPYAEMYARQLAMRAEVEKGHAPDTVFLLEHAPTITLGRQTKPEHLLLSEEAYRATGLAVHAIDRGGSVTYHGPGQVVAYPIFHLQRRYPQPSVRGFLRSLEQVIIHTLAPYGIHGERLEGYTGVWVGGAKIAAMGIGVHQWVTFHGLAINVCPNAAHFGMIIPCGIVDKPITSMAQLLINPPTMNDVMDVLEKALRDYFEPAKEESS